MYSLPYQVSPLEGTFFHGFNAEHLYSIPHLAKDSHITCTHVKSETADPETCESGRVHLS